MATKLKDRPTTSNDDYIPGSRDAERSAEENLDRNDNDQIQNSQDAARIAEERNNPGHVQGVGDAERMAEDNLNYNDDDTVQGSGDAMEMANEQNQQEEDAGQAPNINKLRNKVQDTGKQFKDAHERAQKSLQTADKAIKKGGEQLAKKGAKEGAEQLGKKAAVKAAAGAVTSETGGWGYVAAELADRGVSLGKAGLKGLTTGNFEDLGKEIKKNAKTSIFIIIAFILAVLWPFIMIFLTVLFIVSLISTYNAEQADIQAGTIPLTLTKTGPTTAKAGEILVYTISVDYPTSYSEITVKDAIPAGTTFVSSNQKVTCDNGTCNAASKEVTWKATANNFANPGSYTVTLRSTIDNKYIINIARGEAVGGGTGSTGATAGYLAPNTNTCGGKYTLNNSIKKNFGDPACTANNKKIDDLVKQKDPANAAWWAALIACESTYNPNAFNPNTPDPKGAWGLFQDGSSTPPGKPPAPLPNGKPNFDRGDVNWETQVDNAVGLLKERGRSYWACR